MKLAIAGKNGQLGQELVEDAKRLGHEVFATQRSELDVTDSEAINAYVQEIKPDIFINATAYNLVPQAEEDYENAYKLNAAAVEDMAKACKDSGATFVTYSTDYVFDGTKGSPYEENDEPNPLQKYGLTKLEGEKKAIEVYPEGTFVIRTCALYGGKTGSPEKGTNIVLSLLKNAKEQPYLQAVSDQYVNPTYSKDLSKATFELLGKKAEPTIYHLASEGYCNWVEFAKELLSIAGIEKEIREVKTANFPSSVKKPLFPALANTKAKKLGIVLPSWQEALRSYFVDFDLLASISE